jgi:hypothetical protein
MPTISDRMVVVFRRTGKRQASYAKGRSGGLISRGSRVVPQDAECAGKSDGTPCGYYPGMICCGYECNFPQNCG